MWTVFAPFAIAQLKKCEAGKKFITQPKLWYENAYTSGCHYDGIVPIGHNEMTLCDFILIFYLIFCKTTAIFRRDLHGQQCLLPAALQGNLNKCAACMPVPLWTKKKTQCGLMASSVGCLPSTYVLHAVLHYIGKCFSFRVEGRKSTWIPLHFWVRRIMITTIETMKN